MKFEWELLDKNTRRAKVIGGWVMLHEKHALASKNGQDSILCSESMVFVSDHNHEWVIDE